MHPSFDPRAFDYTLQFRQVGFTSRLVCFELSPERTIRRLAPDTAAMLGYDAAELHGRDILSLFPLNEADAVRAALDRSCMQTQDEIRCTLLGKHGLPFVITPWCLPISLDGSPGTLMIAAAANEAPIEWLALPRATAASVGEYYDDQDYSHDRNFHFGLYDDASDSLTAAADRLVTEFCGNLGSLSNKAVLDLGCGTGNVDVRLLCEYGCRSVHGITVSALQLRFCERAAREANLGERLRFSLMDANEPAFEPDAYDAVVAIESIFHMDREKVFAAAYGALQPGGTFAFCDIYPLEGGIVHSRSGEHTFVSLNQTVRLLRKQGFRNIRLIDWTDRTLPNYTERFGFFVGLASYALEANYSIEQMFDAASSFMQRPLNDAIKTELVAEVLAQTRGQSKANPPFGYFFVAASRPHAA